MFSGAIFDVDGTILESMNVWQEITIKFVTDHGFSATPEELGAYTSMTLEESMPIIREKYGLLQSAEELKADFEGRIRDAYFYDIPPKAGAVEYIKRLKERGIKIAVATSGYRALCEAAFSRLGIADAIDAYALSSEVGVNKSNPDIYLLAAKRIAVPPAECMVFEDLPAGISGAKAAGMQTTAVYDFSNSAETELLKSTADRYISSWRELQEI